METEMTKFLSHVNYLSKEFAEYKDEEKGIEFIFNTVNALATVEYLELEKKDYTILKFERKIEDLDYKIETIKKPTPKNVITGKDEDMYTIVDKEVSIRKVWKVSNRLGALKCFTDPKDAIKFANEINDPIKEIII